MVFYYESGDYIVFVSLSRIDNEDLVKYGVPEDIWFRAGSFVKVFGVDEFSPTTLYVRLHEGETIDNMSENLLEDCAQLLMEHSLYDFTEMKYVAGYTPWSNLQRTLAFGYVAFSDKELIRTIKVGERRKDILDRLSKTKVEWEPDLRAEREAYEAYGPVDYEARLKDKVRIIREESGVNQVVQYAADPEEPVRKRAERVKSDDKQEHEDHDDHEDHEDHEDHDDRKGYAELYRQRQLMMSNRQIAASSREFQEEFANGFM